MSRSNADTSAGRETGPTAGDATRNGSDGSEDGPAEESDGDEADAEFLRARLAVLEKENRRLRREYARDRQASYPRTAVGLGLIGGGAAAAAAAFPSVREILLALSAIGLFSAVMTYYLTPERVVAAETGERIYAAMDETVAALASQLDLTDTHLYVPVDGDPPARLFVPAHKRHGVPDDGTLSEPLVISDVESERGLAVIPAGANLFAAFEETITGTLSGDVVEATEQLADGLVDGFELADTVVTESEASDGRVDARIEGSAYGGGERFDDPLASFIAVGLAQVVESPVSVTVTDTDQRDSFAVTFRWDRDASTASREE